MPECCNLLNLFADIVDIPMYDKEGMRETAKEKKKKIKGKRECSDLFWFTHCGMLFHKRPLEIRASCFKI